MPDFRDYRLTLRLLSPLGTPMHSDTLFGHLCWQMLFREGEEGLKSFLEPFAEGEPAFLVSDAFPAGLLPKPLFPFSARSIGNTPEEYARRKKRRKAPFLREADFLAVLRGEEPKGEPVGNVWRTVSVPHAAISRATFTTGAREDEAGALYFTEAKVLSLPADEAGGGERNRLLQIYIRDLSDSVSLVESLFRALSLTGFGRDKSTGAGAFELLSVEEYPNFAPPPDSDAFVSLSWYVPAAGDPTEGFWKAQVKRGFLGEMNAPDSPGNPNPFKRPFVRFEPGSFFRTGGVPKPFYGRMLKGIAPGFADAVQYGYAFPAACRAPAE